MKTLSLLLVMAGFTCVASAVDFEDQGGPSCEATVSPSLVLGQAPVVQPPYAYYLSAPGRAANTRTTLTGLTGPSRPGLDDPNYIENLAAYHEDVTEDGRRSFSFDIERQVESEHEKIDYSMMLTASYTVDQGQQGPSREQFLEAVKLLRGFEVRYVEDHRIYFSNPHLNIFVNWLLMDGRVTIGAISQSVNPILESVIAREVPAAIDAFATIWPGRLPSVDIFRKANEVARISDLVRPE